ncbi:MAG: response regulator [Candidatus Omnitrophica bacterium]|nr:response regulator [Candidatus Omnitrophota bacterium]
MGKKIMVVDDAAVIRLMLKDILESHQFEVVGECSNGQDAIEKFKALKPDIVTMDIIMPNMDGVQALEEILKFDKNAKVIMVTALDQREFLMKAIRLGAADFIVKPFEDARVIAAIQRVARQI